MSRFGRPGLGFSMFPPVIKFLLIANIAVFFLQYLFIHQVQGNFHPQDPLMQIFALWPVQDWNIISISHEDSFSIWQLLTYQFMHGGFLHIFFNLFALWMFGVELENSWGSARFAAFYILSGVGAGLTQLFYMYATGDVVPTIGASGSVFGILLAFGLSFPNRPIFMFPFFIPIPAKYFVMIYAGIELIMGFGNSSDGVAHFAHLGGAAFGYLLYKYGDQLGIYRTADKIAASIGGNKGNNRGFENEFYRQSKKEADVFKVNWNKPQKEERSSYSEPEPSAGDKSYYIDGELITQEKIDNILDKISASGYQNLTEREKFILTELSKKL